MNVIQCISFIQHNYTNVQSVQGRQLSFLLRLLLPCPRDPLQDEGGGGGGGGGGGEGGRKEGERREEGKMDPLTCH